MVAGVCFASSVPAQSGEDSLDNSTSNCYLSASPSRPVWSNMGSLWFALSRKHVPHVKILILIGPLFRCAAFLLIWIQTWRVKGTSGERRTHWMYLFSSCPLHMDQWYRWKAACTSGAITLPIAVSSPQRLPWPSCSMPRLFQKWHRKDFVFLFSPQTTTNKRGLHHTTHEISYYMCKLIVIALKKINLVLHLKEKENA